MLCFRLLHEAEPASALLDCVNSVRNNSSSLQTYATSSVCFQEIPDAPFVYWSTRKTRNLFKVHSTYADGPRTVKQGLATGDDFRFVRYRWEAPAIDVHKNMWHTFVRASGYSPFYTRLNYLVRWGVDGRELRFIGDPTGRHPRSRMRGADLYFKPGATWPLRGSVFSAQVVPKGCIFSIAGKLATADDLSELPGLIGVMNSSTFDYLIGYYAGNVSGTQYEVGLIGGTPTPTFKDQEPSLRKHFKHAWLSKKDIDSRSVVSPVFHAPALAPGRKPATR